MTHRTPSERSGSTPHCAHRQRRGASIIEALIVVTVGSILLGVSMTMLHLLLRTGRDQSRGVRTAVTLSRLAEVFREDVHASARMEMTPEGDSPDLRLSDRAGREIVYTARGHVLERAERTDGAEQHRDLFHFPPGSAIRFEQELSPALARIAIDLAAWRPQHLPEGRPQRPASGDLTIEAALDRDRRLAGREP